jgi:hypothetical protein
VGTGRKRPQAGSIDIKVAIIGAERAGAAVAVETRGRGDGRIYARHSCASTDRADGAPTTPHASMRTHHSPHNLYRTHLVDVGVDLFNCTLRLRRQVIGLLLRVKLSRSLEPISCPFGMARPD